MRRDHQVIVVGEALVDLIPARDRTQIPVPGGGPFNTARTLGRLGVKSHFLGPVSTDAYGEQLATVLAGDNVQLDQRLRTPRPTSLAIATIDAQGTASYEFRFEGTSAEGLTPAEALAVLPANLSACHMGSLGLVLEPLASAIEAVATALSVDTLLMLDPNMRPSIIRDRAAHANRFHRLLKHAQVVKASDDDLRVMYPGLAPDDAARKLLARGPALILLTRGASGVTALGTFGSCNIPTPRVRVADTIGAGDIFSGAWLARWLELDASLSDQGAIVEASAFACRAAALSCTRKGAVPPTREDIEAFR